MRTALLLTCALAWSAPSCNTLDATGRTQVNFFSIESEMSMGAQAYDEMLAGEPIVTRGADAEMVERIGKRVAAVAEEMYPNPAELFDWEFKLIRADDTINAWALPGGKCAVYTGLLSVTQSEDALAVVMGHEVAHALLRHGGERMSHNALFSAAIAGTSIALREQPPQKQRAILGALGVGGTVGVMLPFSRSHESEADEVGLKLAAAAGYDPRAAIPLWQRMGAAGGAKPPEFLSTHPAEETRIQRLQKIMPEAMELYRAAGGQP